MSFDTICTKTMLWGKLKQLKKELKKNNIHVRRSMNKLQMARTLDKYYRTNMYTYCAVPLTTLRVECKKRKLLQKGNKREIVKRLMDDDKGKVSYRDMSLKWKPPKKKGIVVKKDPIMSKNMSVAKYSIKTEPPSSARKKQSARAKSVPKSFDRDIKSSIKKIGTNKLSVQLSSRPKTTGSRKKASSRASGRPKSAPQRSNIMKSSLQKGDEDIISLDSDNESEESDISSYGQISDLDSEGREEYQEEILPILHVFLNRGREKHKAFKVKNDPEYVPSPERFGINLSEENEKAYQDFWKDDPFYGKEFPILPKLKDIEKMKKKKSAAAKKKTTSKKKKTTSPKRRSSPKPLPVFGPGAKIAYEGEDNTLNTVQNIKVGSSVFFKHNGKTTEGVIQNINGRDIEILASIGWNRKTVKKTWSDIIAVNKITNVDKNCKWEVLNLQ